PGGRGSVPRRRLPSAALGRLRVRGHRPLERSADARAARAVSRTSCKSDPADHRRRNKRTAFRPKETPQDDSRPLISTLSPQGRGMGGEGRAKKYAEVLSVQRCERLLDQTDQLAHAFAVKDHARTRGLVQLRQRPRAAQGERLAML